MKKPNRRQFVYHMTQVYYGYFRNEGFNHELSERYANEAAIMMADYFTFEDTKPLE